MVNMNKKFFKQRIAVLAVSALTAGVFSGLGAPSANAAVVAVTTANAAVAADDLQVSTAIAATAVANGTSTAAKSLGLNFHNDATTSAAVKVVQMTTAGVLSLYTGAATGNKVLLTASGGVFSSALGIGVNTPMPLNAANTPTGAAADTRVTGTFTTSGGALWTPSVRGVYTITLHTGAGLDLTTFASTGGVLKTTITVYVGEAALTLGANGAAVTDPSGILSTSGVTLATSTTLRDFSTLATTSTGNMLKSGQIVGHSSPGLTTSAVVVSGGTITSCSTTTNTVTLSADKTTCSSNGNDLAGINVTAIPSAVGTNFVIATKSTNSAATWATQSQITISVVADTVANVFNSGKSSFSVETSGQAASDNVDATYTSAAGVTSIPGTTVINGGTGFFGYLVKDAVGNNLTGSVIGATTTSATCLIGAAGAGTFNSASSTTANSYFQISQAAANTPATCPVNISVNGVTVASRTFTIVGEVKTIEISSQSIVPATAASVAAMFFVAAKDAAGNLVDNASIAPETTNYNANLTGVGTVATKPGGTGATDNGASVTCGAAGKYKMQMKTTNASVVSIKSAVFDITCGGAAVNYSASLDKASYVPGDIATLTIKATDSVKGVVHDANFLGGDAAGAGATNPIAITGSQLTAVTAPVSGNAFVSGVKTYKYIVGSTEGSYNLVVDLPKVNNTTYSQTALTIAYKVVAGTATVSFAEVLQSVVALIASINKQIAALQKLILARR
jgi:hypothetical protein